MSKFLVIKKNDEFQIVFKKGHSISGRYLVVYFLLNSYNENRYGFAVGTKLGSAVIRNRIKRLLRVTVRAVNLDNQPGYDIVIVARAPIKLAGLHSIIQEYQHILVKAKLFNKT